MRCCVECVFVCFVCFVCLCVSVCDDFNVLVCRVGGLMCDAVCCVCCWFVSVCMSVV